jgi:hypothetical protein
MKRGLLAGVAAQVLATLTAWADTPPSEWDAARDPGARQRWALHVLVERLERTAGGAEPEGQLVHELALVHAKTMLEENGAETSDARLRFDLGIVDEKLATLLHRNDLHAKAYEVLGQALGAFPDAPGTGQALEAMAFSLTWLDRPREEVGAWKRYLPQVIDAPERVVPLMNMGEAQMRLGQLDEALASFHEAQRTCELLPNGVGTNSTYALTLWDIAVALDRNGDGPAALRTANAAMNWRVMNWRVGRGQSVAPKTGWDLIADDAEESDVFFVPSWEREWYLALGHAAAAAAAANPGVAARHWAEAELGWDTYVTRASVAAPADRLWLSIARARRETAHFKRLEAEMESKKSTRHPASGSATDE